MRNNKFLKGLAKILNNRVITAFILLIIVFIIGEIIVPGFVYFSHIMTVLQASFFLGLVALGQTIVLVSGKEGLDLSVGSIFTMGAIIGAAVLDGKNINLPVAFAVILVLGFALGLVNGIGISFLGIAPLIMTMAWGIVIQGALLFISKGSYQGGASSILESLGNGYLEFGIFSHNIRIPWVVIIWIIIILIAMFIFKRTTIGYILYGIGANDRAANLLGIRTKVVRMSTYGFSGLLAALSGMLFLGYAGQPHLTLGDKYVLPSVIAVVIGGVSFGGGYGSYIGAVAGSIFLTTMTSILVTLGLNESGRQIITGSVLLILLMAYTIRRNQV
ncbi:MAG: ABC transporter permease [Actinobacteria bacterium]|nr:ABC transporter permease [Actinomycetota bacterium]